MKGYRLRAICPVCHLERWMEVSDVLLPRHINQIAIISLGLMAALFKWLEYRVIVIPFVVYTAFELVRGMVNKRRAICPQCHFDPFLYDIRPDEARKICEARLNELKAVRDHQEISEAHAESAKTGKVSALAEAEAVKSGQGPGRGPAGNTGGPGGVGVSGATGGGRTGGPSGGAEKKKNTA
jgi:hypothetical protein